MTHETSSFLSPEQAAKARPLRAYTADQCAHISGKFARIWQDWQSAWGLTPGPQLKVCPGGMHTGGVWMHVSLAEGQHEYWWTYRDQSDATLGVSKVGLLVPRTLLVLQTVLFGEVANEGKALLVSDLAQQAWQAWLQSVSQLLTPNDAAQPVISPSAAPSHKPWSRALQIQLPWGPGQLCLELQDGLIEVLLRDYVAPTATPASAAPPAQAKTPVLQALKEHPVTLHAELDAVELRLGQIQGLRVGDVIPLTHTLDHPLRVKTPQGDTLCHGWLGQQNTQLAVELTLE